MPSKARTAAPGLHGGAGPAARPCQRRLRGGTVVRATPAQRGDPGAAVRARISAVLLEDLSAVPPREQGEALKRIG